MDEDSRLARILLQAEFEDAGLDPDGLEWALDFYSHMLMVRISSRIHNFVHKSSLANFW